MRYKIELSKEQMRLIAQCLEDCSRFASGQWQMQNTVDAMVMGLHFDERIKRRDDAEELLRQAKKTLLPDMPDNGSFSYNGTPFIGNTYQIYRTILYKLAHDENWNNVYSSPALPSGDLGTINIKSECIHDFVIKFGLPECQNCGLIQNDVLQEVAKTPIQEVICINAECVKRDVCKRVWVIPNKLKQSYSKFKPTNNSLEKFKCDYFKL